MPYIRPRACLKQTKKTHKITKDWCVLGFARNTLAQSETLFGTIATMPEQNTWVVPEVYPFRNKLACKKRKLGWTALIVALQKGHVFFKTYISCAKKQNHSNIFSVQDFQLCS